MVEAGPPKILENAEGNRTTPSVLGVTKAGERVVGLLAKRQAVVNPKNTIFSVKRLIGRKFSDSEVQHDRKWLPYELREPSTGGVEIKMSDISFMPKDVRVGKGTKVTWINEEEVGHYVNTDPHPGHDYFLEQNSKYLKKGETYSLTFDTLGIYPYHCSAHADTMVGNILVE